MRVAGLVFAMDKLDTELAIAGYTLMLGVLSVATMVQLDQILHMDTEKNANAYLISQTLIFWMTNGESAITTVEKVM